MGFLNEEAFFEQHGDRYVVRVTPFSAGYEISTPQKEALFARFKRIDFHVAIETVLAIALIVTLFLTGLLRSETPVAWILLLSILVLAIQTVRTVRQRRRLIQRAVGHRIPDVPRAPLWRALWQARPPLVGRQLAVPLLRLVVVLLALLLLGVNALAVVLVIAATDVPAQQGDVYGILALIFHDRELWLPLLLFNIVMVVMIVVVGFEARRLRRQR